VGLEPSVFGDTSDAAVIAGSVLRPEAFAAIFDRHFGAIHGYLAARVGSARADDLASSTFTIAFERRRRFRSDADSAGPWLFGIATNLLRNERRSEQRARHVLGRLEPADWACVATEGGDHERLAVLLAELDADQRDVLLLYAWAELSYAEIASSLAIPVGTVRSRLARAREHLRSGLGSAGASAPAREVEPQETSE
jgi:RNA polymerase sigma-70 factor, ECF subfamily